MINIINILIQCNTLLIICLIFYSFYFQYYISILKNIFKKEEKNNISYKCENNNTYFFRCCNISFIISNLNISTKFTYKFVQPLVLWKANVLPVNVTFSKYDYYKKIYKKTTILSILHFNNIYSSQNGVLFYKCIAFDLKGGCKCNNLKRLKGKIKEYRYVFSITQSWGSAVFHSIVECLTKIGSFIREILKDKSIFIHLYRSAAVNYLLFLGIDKYRIINGNIYAKSLIITSKSNCGSFSNIHSLYNLRSELRSKSTIDKAIDIVLIKRLGKRSICNFNDLYNKLIINNFLTVIYQRNDSISHIAKIFSSAKVIIAPHGAGLSNIIFCKTDTLIIEILNFRNINLCYYGLAKSLGLKYVGFPIYLSNKQCFKVNATNIINYIYLSELHRKMVR